MSISRVFKKGEVIFKEGDKSGALFLIQTGSIQVYLQRNKQKIDLYKLGPMQILAEQTLAGSQTHAASAVALVETTAMELSSEAVKPQILALNQIMKLIVKSTMDKLKVLSTELRSVKLERDNTPCPQDQTAKVFGALFHTVHYKGEKKSDCTEIAWPALKQYAQRIFGESPKRMEFATNIFVKMKLAKYEMNDSNEQTESKEDIASVKFFNPSIIENFFEFYQYYYFKSGKLELLKVDETAGRIVSHLLDCVKDIAPDRNGIVSIPFEGIVEKFKTQFGINLNTDHFAVIEQKGLYAKRQSRDAGVILSFDLREWQVMLMNWRILKEIDKWNEKSVVDAQEPEESFVKKTALATSGPSCPDCQTGYIEGAKFCSNCGCKFGEKVA